MTAFFQRFHDSGYLCAHRGARSLAPENTLLAVEQARICGADLWETDLRMTADGVFVLCHDAFLQRTTNIREIPELAAWDPWRVDELTWDQLRGLDSGSWYLRDDPFGLLASGKLPESLRQAIPGQRMLRLETALEYCRTYDFPVNLEIKDLSRSIADEQVISALLQVIDGWGMHDKALLSSFHHAYLSLIKQLQPDLATAALVEQRHPDHLLDYLGNLRVDAYHPDERITDAALIESLHQEDIAVMVWTVNDPHRAAYFQSAGATMICTDWPQSYRSAAHSP